MARFDIYRHPDPAERNWVPFVLDVQNSFVQTGSRVVIPLLAANRLSHKLRDLNPEFTVAGETVVLHTTAMAAMDESELRRPVGNLSARQAEIHQALDTLFGGY